MKEDHPKKERKFRSVDEKAAILRQHILEKVPVSDLADEHGVQPSVFYDWQRALMNNASVALAASDGSRRRRENTREAELERELTALEAKLAKKDARTSACQLRPSRGRGRGAQLPARVTRT